MLTSRERPDLADRNPPCRASEFGVEHLDCGRAARKLPCRTSNKGAAREPDAVRKRLSISINRLASCLAIFVALVGAAGFIVMLLSAHYAEAIGLFVLVVGALIGFVALNLLLVKDGRVDIRASKDEFRARVKTIKGTPRRQAGRRARD